MAGNKPQKDGASAPSFASDVAWPEDAVQVGRILDAWGIKGWFKVQAYATQPDAIFNAKHWFLKNDGPKPGRLTLKMLSVREHGEGQR